MRRLVLVLALCSSSAVFAQEPSATQPADDQRQTLKQLSIDELSNIDVTSTLKHAEPLGNAAAAISLVTGVQVARFDGRTWAISARGFDISTANKLVVMIDGRSVYTPLFSGVFWDVQDLILEDVDR